MERGRGERRGRPQLLRGGRTDEWSGLKERRGRRGKLQLLRGGAERSGEEEGEGCQSSLGEVRGRREEEGKGDYCSLGAERGKERGQRRKESTYTSVGAAYKYLNKFEYFIIK